MFRLDLNLLRIGKTKLSFKNEIIEDVNWLWLSLSCCLLEAGHMYDIQSHCTELTKLNQSHCELAGSETDPKNPSQRKHMLNQGLLWLSAQQKSPHLGPDCKLTVINNDSKIWAKENTC